MKRIFLLITTVFILCFLSRFTDGIYCYSCSDSKSEGECQTEIKKMSKSRGQYEGGGDLDSKWLKNCSGPGYENITSCSIEQIETRGTVTSYIRECSDGDTFSVDISLTKALRRLLKPDNQTTCGSITSGHLVCITLCTEDFCNGPSASNILSTNVILIVSNLLLIISILMTL